MKHYIYIYIFKEYQFQDLNNSALTVTIKIEETIQLKNIENWNSKQDKFVSELLDVPVLLTH